MIRALDIFPNITKSTVIIYSLSPATSATSAAPSPWALHNPSTITRRSAPLLLSQASPLRKSSPSTSTSTTVSAAASATSPGVPAVPANLLLHLLDIFVINIHLIIILIPLVAELQLAA